MISFKIPNSIIDILLRLERAGYQAWLVGGCVRDGLMGLVPHDWDICTDAVPDEVKSLFPDFLDYGIRHGTVTVLWNGSFAEITTFRAESTYTDHRRPDHVTFIKDLRSDLARRDFTVNAIAMDVRGNLSDPFGGEADLRAGILRAVGSPEKRFQEDALRMLRAVRFSAQLGFRLEETIRQALRACAPLVSKLAAERVCAELEKTLLTHRPEFAETMTALGLLIPWGISNHSRSLEFLRSLPASRQSRWMGYALTLSDTAPLAQLRLDKKTIAACEAARSLASIAERDEFQWKAAINKYGTDLCLACAEILTPTDQAVVKGILTRGDCCRLEDLAINGRDAMNAGLEGRQIRASLNNALCHVWEHPEDNTPDKLHRFLREEAEPCG